MNVYRDRPRTSKRSNSYRVQLYVLPFIFHSLVRYPLTPVLARTHGETINQ